MTPELEFPPNYPATKWSLEKLAIGESLEFSQEDYFRVSSARTRCQLKHKMKFSIRKTNNQYQIWRLK
jgi:hypothetical protein